MTTLDDVQKLLDDQEAKLRTCIGDECQKIRGEFLKNRPPGITSEQMQGMLDKQLASLKPEPHLHKSYDELGACPECNALLAKNSVKYQLVPKEPKEEEQEVYYEFGGLTPKYRPKKEH